MRRSSLSLAIAVLVTVAVLGGADLDTSSSAITGASYVVAAGDNLTAIADRAGVSLSALAAANHLTDPNVILIGQVLVIPGHRATAVPAPKAVPPGTVRRLATASLDPTCHAPATVWFNAVARRQSTANLPSLLKRRSQRLALRPCFEAWAAYYGVPATLIQGLAWEESGWQNDVVSSANAYGIGQLTPPAINFITALVGRPLSVAIPDQNIRMTARFLAYLLNQTGGNVPQAVAAYYQGLASVRQSGLLPETKQYVTDVLFFSSLFK